MSELSVDKITGKTGTGGSNSPLQFSGDTVTLDTGVTISSGATIGTGVSLANATFPSDHVIQIKTNTMSSTLQDGTKTTNYIGVTALEVSFTASVTNGKFLLMNFGARSDSNYGGNRMTISFQINANGAGYANLGTDIQHVMNGGTYSGYGYQSPHWMYLYTASITAGQNIKFRPSFHYVSGGGSDTEYHKTGYGIATFTVMELMP